MMLKSHKLQYSIIFLAYNNGSSKISVQSESHQQATIHLENELNYLCSSFMKWIGAHKAYLQAIKNWLDKCVSPLPQKSSRGKPVPVELKPLQMGAPPIFITCHDWLNGVEGLEKKRVNVADSIKELMLVIASYLPQQENHGKDHSTMFPSVPRRKTDDGNRNEATVPDWNSGFQGLQTSLVRFFSQLYDFAESSVFMYTDLRQKIEAAQIQYDNPRKQMHSAIVSPCRWRGGYSLESIKAVFVCTPKLQVYEYFHGRMVICTTINFGEGQKLETAFQEIAIISFVALIKKRRRRKKENLVSVVSNSQTAALSKRKGWPSFC